MAIPSQQIGWSQKAKLLWNISKQLEKLIQVTANNANPTTTTTTTTVVPSTYNLKSGPNQFSVCSGSVNLTLYGNLPSLGIGRQLYTNSQLTNTYTPPYTPFLIGYGSGVDDPVWEVNSSGVIISQFGAC
jgi:hypothetical protein